MHRVANSSEIRPNWDSLDGSSPPVPITPEYTLTVKDVKYDSASIEARANVNCILTYNNNVVGSSDIPTPVSISVFRNQPVTVELNDLIGETTYIFDGLFSPTDTSIESGSRFKIYTTPSPPDPEYSLSLLSVGDESAVIEARSNFDCTLEYSNTIVPSENNSTTGTVALIEDVPVTINVSDLAMSTAYLFSGTFTPTDETVASGTRELEYTTTFSMKIVEQTLSLNPNVGIVALPVQGKESTRITLNASTNSLGSIRVVFTDVDDESIKAPRTLLIERAAPGCDAHLLKFDATGGTNNVYRLRIDLSDYGAGEYSLRVNYLISNDFDGLVRPTHAVWSDADDEPIQGNPGYIDMSVRGEWRVAENFITIAENPSFVFWYVGYPVQGTTGHVYMTNLKLTAPNGEQLISDGLFPNGQDMDSLLDVPSPDLISIVPCSEAPSPTPAIYFQEGFTSQGFQTFSGTAITKSKTYRISVEKLIDEDGNEYDDDTSILYTTADEDTTNDLTVEAAPLTGQVNLDGDRPGETAFDLQIAVTQYSTCLYTVTDTSANAIVPSPQFEAGHNFAVDPIMLTPSQFAFATWVYLSSSAVPDPGTEDSLLLLTGVNNPADEIFVNLRPDRKTRIGYKINGNQPALDITNGVSIPLDTWTHCAFVFVPREGGSMTRGQFFINGVEIKARTSDPGKQVALILNQEFTTSIASTFKGQLANVAIWDAALYKGGNFDTLVNTNEIPNLTRNVVRFGFGAMTLIDTVDIDGGDQTTVTVADLTPSTAYNCKVVAASAYPTITEELTVTTLTPIGQIDLSISLELAPFPDNENTIRLFITVGAACNCEVTILGLGSVPPRFTETFDGPTARRQLEFDGLLPNNTYVANVVASAPDLEDNEQTTSIITAAPFPELTKFEEGSVGQTFADVTVSLDRPGFVTLLFESVPGDVYFDSAHLAEEVELTITQENIDEGGMTYRFSDLLPDKRYKCTIISIGDTLGNTVSNDSEIVLMTLPPPFELAASLTVPQQNGDTSLVANYGVNHPSLVQLFLYVNETNELARQEELTVTDVNESLTFLFSGLIPSTRYDLLVRGVRNFDGAALTKTDSAITDAQFELTASLTVPEENGDTSLVATYQVNKTSSLQLFLFKNATNQQVQYEQFQVNDINVPLTFKFFYLEPSTQYDLQVRAVSDSDGSVVVKNDSETTLAPPPLQLTASLSVPQDNGDSSLLATYQVNRPSTVELDLSVYDELVQSEVVMTEDTNVPLTYLFQNLAPLTQYDLTVTATSDGSVVTQSDSAMTLDVPISTLITAYLESPPDNPQTVLFVRFSVSKESQVNLKLAAQNGEMYEQEYEVSTTDVEIGAAFTDLTPNTLYTLTATATTYADGAVGTATDSQSTAAAPTLVSVDILSTSRGPVSGSSPTSDGHIMPLEGQVGPWNGIVVRAGQSIYVEENLLNGLQQQTNWSIVLNSNRAQHTTFALFKGDEKTNCGEDILAIERGKTGNRLEGYFTGLDDTKIYTIRMFGQHYIDGNGSVNYARFGVKGETKDTGPNTATCTFSAVSPTAGNIYFSLEFADNNYSSISGIQIQEEVESALQFDTRTTSVSYPLQLQITEEFVYQHEEGRMLLTSAAVDASDLPTDGDMYLYVLGLPLHNKIVLQGESPNNTNILAKLNKSGVLLCNDDYYDLFVPKNWVGTLRFGITVQTFENGALVQKDLEGVLGRKPVISVDFHFD